MPEHAEVRLMAEYINSHCEDKVFFHVKKNPVNKQAFSIKTISKLFNLKAVARGKEIQLQHIPLSPGDTETAKLTITMGMSGNFVYKDKNDPPSKWPMLTWIAYNDNNEMKDFDKLELIDHRRFAKWKFRDWNPSRGFDIVTEHDEFRKNILEGIKNKIKKFNKPLCEILMDQSYFNGVGNYLLAEILGRLNVNPFQNLLELKKKKVEELLDLCYQLPNEAFVLGGGQLKDWKNQNNVSATDFKSWLKFYQHKNSLSAVTGTGRNFWYNKKWKKYCPYAD